MDDEAPTRSLPDPGEGGSPAGVGPGDAVGPFRLLERLGEGGFGVVFLAEQTEPVTRRVALKIIKPGMGSREVLARFEAERQALAMMDHPCVAKVFHGGTTEHGLPYFAMEYVEGEPITSFCDRHRLALDDRLSLFVRVCEAVQHAHAKGVIHRDLKPGNVLAAYDADGRAQPKVIDFGIAKALDRPLSEATVFTEHGQMIGTPEYMSPEQAEMGPLGVDTRTDVYALGVILYELLTGRRPFDGETLRAAGLAEIHRIIREVEPPRPSTRLSEPGEAPASIDRVASDRRTQARSLTGILRRDLDWVAMRCLEKDRERRYATPSELASDVRRYLADEPLVAGPPSVSYRAAKFLRRHRAAALTGGVVAVALVAATAVSARFAVVAARERAGAEREAAAARAVTEFLTDDLLLAAGLEDDGATPDPDVRVSEALDRASARVGDRFDDAPLVRARVLSTIGRAYRAIGVPARAVRPLEEAGALFRAQGGTDPADLIRNDLALGLARWRLGESAEALETIRAALAEAEGARDRDPAVYWGARAELGNALKHDGRADEAEAEYRAVIEGRTRDLGPGDPSIAVTRYNLALLPVARALEARRAGDEEAARALFEEGLGLLREAERALEDAYGPDHRRTLAAVSEVAVQLNRLDRLDEAAPIYDDLVPRLERTLGAGHHRTLMATANNGILRQKLGRHGEAAAMLARALDGFRVAEGDASGTTVAVAGLLATSLLETGAEADAIALLRRTEADLRAAGETERADGVRDRIASIRGEAGG